MHYQHEQSIKLKYEFNCVLGLRMKVINIKSVLILTGFLWVCFSFLGFSHLASKNSAEKIAESNLRHAKNELLQKSKELRFKLGQWAYNYHLVKTKGLDFDQDGFLASDFNDIFFFKLVDNNLKTQWIKSKDMSSAVVPRQLLNQLKPLSKEQILEKEFLYFSDKTKLHGPKVFFGFPIEDEQMGEGFVLGSLDLDYVNLISSELNTYMTDARGRFVFHPKKEYIAQNATHLTAQNNKDVFVKTAQLSNLGLEFIYITPKSAIWVDTFWPMFVMCLGLLLAFGVLIFEVYMQAPLNLKTAVDISSSPLKASEATKDEYGSILKLNEVRDSLNQMSLLSSVLKGRIDLAANGELNTKLFEDIKSDFETLDKTIETTYRSAQNLESGFSSDLNSKQSKATPSNSETAESLQQIVGGSSSILIPEGQAISNNSQVGSPSQSISQAALAFKDQGFDLDDDEDLSDQDQTFESLMDFTDLDLEDDLGEEFSVQLDNLAFGDNKNSVEDDFESVDSDQAEGVVFQEYIGADSEANDWAKIIEELTEEINTAPLKPSDLASQSVEFNEYQQTKTKDDTFHG